MLISTEGDTAPPELRVTPAAMSHQGMDRVSKTDSMPMLRHKAAMTAHEAASIVRAASDEADAYKRKVEEQLRARDELRQRMRAQKGENLHPEHFGCGYCSAGRTVPRANGSSLVSMASLGRLQELSLIHI